MKRTLNYLLVLFIFMFVGMISVSATSMKLDPETIEVGKSTNLKIIADTCNDGRNCNLKLEYDSALLELSSSCGSGNDSSSTDIDYSKLISDSNIILTKKSDKILLYNTHTSESYANSEKFTFEYTGIRRTTDANYNMLRIAKELNNNLNEKGFNSIQDTTPHDYGTYTSAYAKSRITLQNAISSYGGFGLAIDVHRDAIENLDFRPTVNIRGVEVARIMLVIGAGSRDNKNPYFEDNLKLALKLQYIGEKIYPGLFRTMYIRNSIYNQDLNKYSLLIEVGASGNSIEEAQMATRCITNLLNIIYKD